MAGETVAGSPYTITATLSPAGVLGNYASPTRAQLHDRKKNAAWATPAASKTYGDADPAPCDWQRLTSSWRTG